MNIILFNGPPSSGKDTAATFIYDVWYDKEWTKGVPGFERMSMPNKMAFAGTTDTECDELGINKTYEKIKDQPLDILNGKSYRQWQIDFSEKFMKPLYGEDIFARLFLQRISGYGKGIDATILVPDCGFQIEADTLSLSEHSIYLLRIYRFGCDFSKDSRGYILPHNRTKQFGMVENDGTMEEFETKIEKIVKNWIGTR